jgi:hypothetical protein
MGSCMEFRDVGAGSFGCGCRFDDGCWPRVNAGNEEGYHMFRGANWLAKLFVVLACIALSPVIYGYSLWMWWTGELAEIDI